MKKVFNVTAVVVITAATAVISGTCFGSSYLRLAEALRDLFHGAVSLFCKLFGIETGIKPAVNEYSEVLRISGHLPGNAEELKARLNEYFALLLEWDNFIRYSRLCGKVVSFICFGALAGKTAINLILKLYLRLNNDYGKESLPLKAVKKIEKSVLIFVIRPMQEVCIFLKERPFILKMWLIVWIANFNLLSIAAEFVAYVLFVAESSDVSGIFVLIYKLLVDLQVIFKSVSVWGVAVLALWIFDRRRKKTALNRLARYEARNCGFVKDLPVVTLVCASMGKKKTTLITDMALSQSVMFRQEALKRLQKTDIKFGRFPWQEFEIELNACIKYGTVYNLASVKAWVEKKRGRYNSHNDAALQLYGYDVLCYGDKYNNGLYAEELFDTLSVYARLYFVYAMQSGLIVSNYSVRESTERITLGNFPLWNYYFSDTELAGRYSHILDFDVLRLGKKVKENNEKSGSFEFGVVVITEVGKERGNNLELKEVKKAVTETNQKNDLFNSWLKMSRHSATIDNYPFIKVFADEQRPESWGADARELADILHITNCGEERIALPFYDTEEMICEIVYDKIIALYTDLRYYRGDETLLVRLLKRIASAAFNRLERVRNLYGYTVLKIEKERGTRDGKREKRKYYLCNRKIYNRRFTTDCFADYFHEAALKSKTGIDDYEEYAAIKATVAELKEQNSYFMNALYKRNEENKPSATLYDKGVKR